MTESLEVGNQIMVDRPFGKVIKQIKAELAQAELEIAAEFEVDRNAPAGNTCRLLLIDCPLTDFEVLTLDAATAVFLPLHIVVTSYDSRTRIFWANTTALVQGRLPAGATAPLQRLEGRIARVLFALADADSTTSGKKPG